MKNLIYISAISFLLVSLVSCYTNKTLTSQGEFKKYLNKRNDSSEYNKKVKVLMVVTKGGDTIIFNKKNPGWVTEDGVFGFPKTRLPYSSNITTSFSKKSLQYIFKDNTKYEFISQDNLGYICWEMDTLNIPFAEIRQMKIRKLSMAGTICWSTFGVLSISFIVAMVAAGVGYIGMM